MKKNTFSKILKLMKPYLPLLLLSILLGAIYVICSLLIPYLFGKSIDLIIGKDNVDFSSLKTNILYILILIGISIVSTYLMNLINGRIVFETVRDLRKKSFSKLSKLPLSYIDSRPAGEIVNNVITDSENFGDGILIALTQFFTGILTIIGVIIFMMVINIYISLAVILMTPISLFIAKMISSKSYTSFKERSNERGRQTSIIDEMVGSQKIVQSYSFEDDALKIFDSTNDKLSQISLRATFISSLVNPSTRLINAIIYALVALIGSISIVNGSGAVALTIGGLTTLLGYVNQYTKPFNEITSVVTELQNSFACFQSITELIEEKDEKDDGEDIKLEVPESIRINDISFSYSEERPLIENFSLDIKRGERIAIVGPTGCGKTTFINLLMRFYDLKKGSIEFDSRDVSTVKRSSLRDLFGMVLQDTWIRSGTIKDIITMGDETIPMEKIIDACRNAKILHFIEQLPNKFDTMVNESSDLLSSGEKQLLCIARVMLKDPDILILDEATSNIDTRTEVLVQEAFLKLMEGKTSFIVAHRLSTIKNADKIIVMKDGKIIESGNHKELLERKGFYFELYNSQFAH